MTLFLDFGYFLEIAVEYRPNQDTDIKVTRNIPIRIDFGNNMTTLQSY